MLTLTYLLSPVEKRKLNVFESIDYFAPNSAVYRRWLARQVKSHQPTAHGQTRKHDPRQWYTALACAVQTV